MKRFLAAVAGAIGLGALLRHRQRQRAARLEPSRAEELRARLDEVEGRSTAVEQQPAAGEAPAPSDVEVRRREVHERARQAANELQ